MKIKKVLFFAFTTSLSWAMYGMENDINSNLKDEIKKLQEKNEKWRNRVNSLEPQNAVVEILPKDIQKEIAQYLIQKSTLIKTILPNAVLKKKISHTKILGKYNDTVQHDSHSLAFSPDSKYLAVGTNKRSTTETKTYDHIAKLWNTQTGRHVATPVQHNGPVQAVAFSSDGKYFATGCNDGTVQLLWKTKTEQYKITLEEHRNGISSVGFSPNNRYFATGSWDKTAKLWDLKTRRCIHTLAEHCSAINATAFSPNSKYFATGSSDKTVKLWDVETGKCIQTLAEHQGSINSVAFSPDGKKIATGSSDYTAKLWDIKSGTCTHTLTGHEHVIHSIAFLPNGNYLITGASDASTRLWDIQTNQCVRVIQTPNAHSLALSPDGNYFATGGCDFAAKLWNIENWQKLPQLKAYLENNLNFFSTSVFAKIESARSSGCTFKPSQAERTTLKQLMDDIRTQFGNTTVAAIKEVIDPVVETSCTII